MPKKRKGSGWRSGKYRLIDTRQDRMRTANWVVVDDRKRMSNPFDWRKSIVYRGSYRNAIKWMERKRKR